MPSSSLGTYLYNTVGLGELEVEGTGQNVQIEYNDRNKFEYFEFKKFKLTHFNSTLRHRSKVYPRDNRVDDLTLVNIKY